MKTSVERTTVEKDGEIVGTRAAYVWADDNWTIRLETDTQANEISVTEKVGGETTRTIHIYNGREFAAAIMREFGEVGK